MSRLHAEADRFEPRLARAYVRAARRLSDRVPIVALADAIERRDVAAAMHTMTDAGIEAALVPMGDIVRDAFVRGGKVEGEDL